MICKENKKFINTLTNFLVDKLFANEDGWGAYSLIQGLIEQGVLESIPSNDSEKSFCEAYLQQIKSLNINSIPRFTIYKLVDEEEKEVVYAKYDEKSLVLEHRCKGSLLRIRMAL